MDNGKFKSLKKKYFFYKNYILEFIKVIKPGIILGNLITLMSGFFLASQGGQIKYDVLFYTIISVMFIIASACIINNILDKDIDQYMQRTKKRILCVFHGNVWLIFFLWCFAFFLLVFGCMILYFHINILCIMISLISYFFYVFLYSFVLKRTFIFSTIIGSVSGSTPPILGYVAVKNHLDLFCIIIFFMFSFWQIAHSYSISIFRLKDYQRVRIPLFAVIYGVEKTKIHISICIIFLMLLNFFLYFFYYVSILYFFFITISVLIWYFFSVFGNLFFNDLMWSRIMFLSSILVIFLISFMMFVNFFCY